MAKSARMPLAISIIPANPMLPLSRREGASGFGHSRRSRPAKKLRSITGRSISMPIFNPSLVGARLAIKGKRLRRSAFSSTAPHDKFAGLGSPLVCVGQLGQTWRHENHRQTVGIRAPTGCAGSRAVPFFIFWLERKHELSVIPGRDFGCHKGQDYDGNPALGAGFAVCGFCFSSHARYGLVACSGPRISSKPAGKL